MQTAKAQWNRNNTWSYLAGNVGVDRAAIALEVNGRPCSSGADAGRTSPASRNRRRLLFHGGAVELTATLAGGARSLRVSGIIRNVSAAKVLLGRCFLLDTALGKGRIRLGGNAERLTFLQDSGWCVPNRVVAVHRVPQRLVSKTIGHLFNPDAGVCLNTSFLTFDRANTEIVLEANQPDPLAHYRVYCDLEGYELLPGQSIASETLYVAIADDPFQTLEDYATAVARHYRPKLWSRPPVGWCGGTWDGITSRSEQGALRSAAAIRKQLAGFDVDFIWFSINNLEKGLPGNWFKINKTALPHGISGLAQRLRKFRFKLGLWVAPFWVCREVKDQWERNRDNLLRMKDGSPMIYRKRWPYGYYATQPAEKRPDFYALDGSHPQTISYLTEIFKRYRRMGVRYYMVDFLDAGSGSMPGARPYDLHHDKRMIKGPEVYSQAMRAIRRAAGEDTYFLSSTGPTYLNIGSVHGVRTGCDFGEGRNVNKGTWFYPATIAFGKGGHLDYMSALQNMAVSWFAHNKWYFNDAGNVLTVDKPLPLKNAHIHATFFGICGGPMMLGDNIARIDAERLALIKKCLPRVAQCAVPVDLFSACAPEGRPAVFRLDLRRPWGNYQVLAIFNDQPCETVKTISARELRLNPARRYQIYDFWNEAYVGTRQEKFEFVVPGETVGLYRIQEWREHPWLLSTDMHILQGAVEIERLKWDARSGILSGRATRPRGEEGNLFIIAPEGWKPVDYRDLWVAKHSADRTILVKKHIVFDRPAVSWKIAFERYTV